MDKECAQKEIERRTYLTETAKSLANDIVAQCHGKGLTIGELQQLSAKIKVCLDMAIGDEMKIAKISQRTISDEAMRMLT